MSKPFLYRCVVLAVAVCALWGIGRSAALRFHEQREALLKVAVAEQGRLGLTNRAQLFAKYPSPELGLCKVVQVSPGATAEVVVPGKFVAGSKFLFENDDIDVVKEAATTTEYRATIRAAANAAPCLAAVHAFSPVSAGAASCDAVQIGGTPEWQFSAANGWAIRLIPQEEKTRAKGRAAGLAYRAEFTRRGERQPFETFPARMKLEDACPTGNYEVNLEVERDSGSAPGGVEEYQKLAQQMQKPGITPQEYEKLLQRMTELATQMQKSMEASSQKLNQSLEMEQRLENFGCKQLEFTLLGGTANGNLNCRDASGATQPVKITGTLKMAAR